MISRRWAAAALKKLRRLWSPARLTIELIRPRYLWYALENAVQENNTGRNHVRELFKTKLGDSYDKLYGDGMEIKEKLENFLMDILLDDPLGNTASSLLNAHSALEKSFIVGACTAPETSTQDRLPCRLSSPSAFLFPSSWSHEWQEEYKADDAKWTHPKGYQRKFGISVGKDPAELTEVTRVFEDFKATYFYAEYVSSLNRGRLSTGLDLLTENYLTIQSKARSRRAYSRTGTC